MHKKIKKTVVHINKQPENSKTNSKLKIEEGS
jgi:hypothetical protein